MTQSTLNLVVVALTVVLAAFTTACADADSGDKLYVACTGQEVGYVDGDGNPVLRFEIGDAYVVAAGSAGEAIEQPGCGVAGRQQALSRSSSFTISSSMEDRQRSTSSGDSQSVTQTIRVVHSDGSTYTGTFTSETEDGETRDCYAVESTDSDGNTTKESGCTDD